jgi:hypothetical protein
LGPPAAIRPSDVELPLFVHVLGAMILVGTLLAAATAFTLSWRRKDVGDVATLTRFGLWTIVAGVLPAWLLMRVGAQWVYSEAGWEEVADEPGWLGVGYITADAGGLLILVSVVLAIVGLRRRRGTEDSPSTLGRIVGVIAVLLLVAYLVAVWAMTAKPD